MEAVAKLRDYPTSPRKMRLVADTIRGKKASDALGILKFTPNHAARPLEKLLLSAMANWTNKAENSDANIEDVYVKTIFVDGGASLKRHRPAPHGRAHRIRKRSNHVTIIVDTKGDSSKAVVVEPATEDSTES